jgi:hypothetical protein
MMANCEGSCDGQKGADLQWFKISEEGYDVKNHAWPTTIMAKALYGYNRTFTLPTNLPDGQYLLSSTLLALHSAKAPQYYPTAWQIDYKGTASKKVTPSPQMQVVSDVRYRAVVLITSGGSRF